MNAVSHSLSPLSAAGTYLGVLAFPPDLTARFPVGQDRDTARKKKVFTLKY